MRRLITLVLSLFALAAHAAPMGADDARHLLNRAGFGATPREIYEFSRLSREQAVDRLLSGAVTTAATPLPDAVDE